MNWEGFFCGACLGIDCYAPAAALAGARFCDVERDAAYLLSEAMAAACPCLLLLVLRCLV